MSSRTSEGTVSSYTYSDTTEEKNYTIEREKKSKMIWKKLERISLMKSFDGTRRNTQSMIGRPIMVLCQMIHSNTLKTEWNLDTTMTRINYKRNMSGDMTCVLLIAGYLIHLFCWLWRLQILIWRSTILCTFRANISPPHSLLVLK